MKYRGASIPELARTESAAISVGEGTSVVRFDFTPKGKDSTMTCETVSGFTVSETNRTIVIDNATQVVDVGDSDNKGTLSQITLSTKQYTVTFDAAGGTVNPASKQVSPGGTIAELPTPTKADNTFGGWYTKTEGGGTQFTTSTKVEADITVFAKWTAVSSATGKIEVVNTDAYYATIDHITIYDGTKTSVIHSKDVSLSKTGSKETFTVSPGDYVVEVMLSTANSLTTEKFSVLANGMRRVNVNTYHYTIQVL